MKKNRLTTFGSFVAMLSLLVAPLVSLADSATTPAPSNDTQSCSTITVWSGSDTKTAGYFESNGSTTIANATAGLNASNYSVGSLTADAVVTTTNIPPWVDPATDSHFSTSSAKWISSAASNNEGSSTADQWRLFSDSFTLPAGAVVSSAEIAYTADNAVDVHLNGNTTPIDSTGDVYGTPASTPENFTSVFTTSFTPVIGENTLSFVVRNWGTDNESNPTGLLYKATVNYCIPVVTPDPEDGVVHIFKYVDGVKATSADVGGVSFPMITPTYGNAPFTLGPSGWTTGDDPYEASTASIDGGNTYTAHEDTSTSLVGTTCDADASYELIGYSTGNTLVDAQNATKTDSAPTVTVNGDKYIIVWNEKCDDVSTSTVAVHIEKYIDGVKATASSANSSAFPMTASWDDTSNGGVGSGSYTLSTTGYNSPNAYEAVTKQMTSGSDYSTHEVTGGSVVGNTCSTSSAPYALVGYRTGSTHADAVAATTTLTEPSFTNITSDRYVIVLNESCDNATSTPGTGTGSISGTKYEPRSNTTRGWLRWFIHPHTVAGVTIYLDINNNTVLDTGEPSTTTNKKGKYKFSNLGAGTYYVREVVQSGWTQVSPASGKWTVVLTDDQNVSRKDFVNTHLGTISGMKFNDANANRRKDSSEVGLAGWTIVAKAKGVSTSTVTDANGNYTFTNLAPGTYKLSEVMQNGWRQTVHPSTVKVQSGTNAINKNFGNTQKNNNNNNWWNRDRGNNDDEEDDD